MNELSSPLTKTAYSNHISWPHRDSEVQKTLDVSVESLTAKIVPDSEIPAFQLFTSQQTSPVVLSVPHGGWLYPESLITSENFNRCASLTDTGTAQLGVMLNTGKYPVLMAGCCRAACDLNRPPSALDARICADAKSPIPAIYKSYVNAGYGVIPRLSAHKLPLYANKLHRSQWQALLNKWHAPYHRRLAELLSTAARHYNNEAMLIDLHSMPDGLRQKNKQRSLPDFVFGNLNGTTLTQKKVETINATMRSSHYSWCWNVPYAGGYITRHHSLAESRLAQHRPSALQIEVNRSLYTDSAGRIETSRLVPVCRMLNLLITTLVEDLGV